MVVEKRVASSELRVARIFSWGFVMRGLRFGGFGAMVAWLVVGLLVGLVGPVSAQGVSGGCVGKQCADGKNVQSAVRKVEGWAQVPGGTVWLEPGRQAYEHDTGLVRDLVTGQKSYPVQPSSQLSYSVPRVSPRVVAPQVGPRVLSPFQVPQVYQPYANPYYVPQYQHNSRNSIDVGPYGVGGGCNSCGAIATHGAISSQWRKVQ